MLEFWKWDVVLELFVRTYIQAIAQGIRIWQVHICIEGDSQKEKNGEGEGIWAGEKERRIELFNIPGIK